MICYSKGNVWWIEQMYVSQCVILFDVLKNPSGPNTIDDNIDLSGLTSSKVSGSNTTDAILDHSGSSTGGDNEKLSE